MKINISPTFRPTVIVLAAGRGERFKASGGSQDKLNATLNGRALRDHVLVAVRSSGLPFFVVEREHIAHLKSRGMGDSIAYGVETTAQANGWLILPADLPLIRPQTLLAVAQALLEAEDHAVVVPFYQGKQGHPVGFKASCGDALKQLTGDRGARSVVTGYPSIRLDLNDEGMVMDVDTLLELNEAEKRLAKRMDFVMDQSTVPSIR